MSAKGEAAKFKQQDFNSVGSYEVKKETEKLEEIRVVKSGEPTTPTVKSFAFHKINDGKINYSEVKKKYGSLAITDAERSTRQKQDSRFQLTPLQRDPLAVEEEERRVIDQRVKDRVEALAEEARKNAMGIGYQDGLKKGYIEAFNQFQKDGLQRLELLSRFISEAEGLKEQIFMANERFLIELVYRLAKTVMLKDLSQDPQYLLRLAKELIERVGVRENITLKISDAESETISMLKGNLESMVGNLKNLNVQVSNQVKPGGCIIETEWNAINANLETQLKGLYDSLLGVEQGESDRGSNQ